MSNAKPSGMNLMHRGPIFIGLFALFVWTHGITQIWLLPSTSNNLPIELQWSLWREGLAFMLVGLTAGVLACFAVRFWWVAIFLTSGAMLLINIPPLVSNILDSPSFTHWLEVWSIVFGRLIGQGKTAEVAQLIYSLFVYPLYHLILVMGTMLYLFWFHRNQRHASPTAA